MKFTKNKKIAMAAIATPMISTVVNASIAPTEAVAQTLGDYISIVAEFLTVFCLIIFAMYMGRFLAVNTKNNSEGDTKIISGLKNGMMTALIGMAICQAAIIVAQLIF